MIKDNAVPLRGTTGQLMIMAAHRYCLGRQSYIVSAGQEWLRLWWKSVEDPTREVIIRDTVEALMLNLAGSQYDARDWKLFAEWGWAQLSYQQRTTVAKALSWRHKPWPLDCGEELPETWEQILGIRITDPDGWQPDGNWGLPLTRLGFERRARKSIREAL